MYFRQICTGLTVALGLAGQPGSADTITGPTSRVVVTSSECPGQLCRDVFGDSAEILLWPVGNPTRSGAFLSYDASSSAAGIFASAVVSNRARNGTVTVYARDVFTLGTLDKTKPETLETTALLNVSGTAGEGLGGDGSRFRLRSGISGVRPVAEVSLGSLVGTSSIETTSVQLGGLLDGVIQPGVANLSQTPAQDITVTVGVPFQLKIFMELFHVLDWSSPASFVQSSFTNSARVGFDLPEGYFITSARGYSQGLPVAPPPAPTAPIPLPAALPMLVAGLALLFGLRRRRG
ncbi:hypothetical protein [Pararhodobacter sp. SW119]|uniref:hypothetical protein n=1 Tax=Pararhodobacter sp. SW119 TaxID=2780075 RepID=UPI001AE07DF4|nr:hypothetical protein [Pararhodobacter sp. SW119]